MEFKKWASQARLKFERFVQIPFDEALRESEFPASFVSQSLIGLAVEDYPALRSTAGSLYGGVTTRLSASHTSDALQPAQIP